MPKLQVSYRNVSIKSYFTMLKMILKMIISRCTKTCLLIMLKEKKKKKNLLWPVHRANKPGGLDSNRCSPDAFVYTRGISCSRREYFGGVNATLRLGRPAVGRFIPLPAFGMWVAASRVAMSPVLAALHRDMFMGVSTRATVSSTDSPCET